MKNTTFGPLAKLGRSVKAVLFLSLFSFSASAQIFWTENWTAAGAGWNLAVPTGTEGADPNFFKVADFEGGGITPDLGAPTSCGVASNGNNTMHITSVFNPNGGAAYDAGGLCGFLFCPLTNRRAESPTINCSGKTTITATFNYIEGGQGTSDDASFWYFDGTTWAQLDNMPKTLTGCGGQGLWKSRVVALPVSADNNPNVKIAFRWVNNDDGAGSDPSFAVDDIALATTTTSNTITTGVLTGPFCGCMPISVPFTSTGTFTAGNIYTAELSNAAGSFAAPVVLGTLVSTANTGTINGTIPCTTVFGTGYRVRVTSTLPPITGSDNGVNLTINAAPQAAFIYSPSSYCQNATDPSPTFLGSATAGTFTATPAGLVFVSTSTGQVDVSASAPGTYTVTNTIAASGGCAFVTADFNITIVAAPVATFSYTGTPYCQNVADPSPTYSGGGVAGTFTSTTGLIFVSPSTGQVDLSASTPGTYTVTNTVTSSGCTATATSSIVINAAQDSTFSYPASAYCQSGTNPTPTVTGTAGGTFTSSPAGLVFVSSSTGEINLAGSTLGTYSVTYTTPGPCASSMTVSVTITTAVDGSFYYSMGSYCQDDFNDPSPTYLSTAAPGTFTASPGGLVFLGTMGQVDLSASTPGTYTVTNINAASGGCPADTAIATIIINAVQDSTFAYSASTFCQSGANPTPTITGTAGGTFTSSPAGLVFVSSSTGEIDLAGSALGTYSVTYTTPGPCAGSMTVSVTITTSPDATFSYANAAYCQNDPNPSPVFTGSASAGTFSASPAGLVFVSPSTGQVDLAGSTPGTYTVTNTVSASGCPTSTATTTITINASPTVTVNSPVICSGDVASLTASGGGGSTTYTWSAGVTPTSGASVSASPTATTSYTVTATDSGCSATAVAVVTVNNCNVPDANFSGTPQVMCQAGCVNFTDLSTNSPTSWSWSFPGATPATSTAQNPTNICYSADGSYSVTLIATNASGSDTLTQAGFITVGVPVTVLITGNLLITSCEETVLTADPADGTYVWGPSSSLSSTSGASVTASPSETQQFYVTYTSPEGCVDSDTTTVVVEDINTWFLPTGFTPNGDGINDEIHLHGRGIDFFTLKIFDRIGEKVFETSDLEKGWNGRLFGIPMNNGVFVYTLDITFCNGEHVKKHGDITLVK